MKYLLIINCLILSTQLFAQNHHHEANEVGLGLGPSFSLDENEWAPALHIHYLRYFGEHSTYGISVGFESIFDEHSHYSLTTGFHYKICQRVTFGLSPGISRSAAENDWEFVTHFEAVSEFELGFLHMGPMIEYAIGQNHSHLLLGLHIGLGF